MAPSRLIRTGLDYPAVESAMRLMGIAGTTDTFNALRHMEQAALNEMARHA